MMRRRLNHGERHHGDDLAAGERHGAGQPADGEDLAGGLLAAGEDLAGGRRAAGEALPGALLGEGRLRGDGGRRDGGDSVVRPGESADQALERLLRDKAAREGGSSQRTRSAPAERGVELRRLRSIEEARGAGRSSNEESSEVAAPVLPPPTTLLGHLGVQGHHSGLLQGLGLGHRDGLLGPLLEDHDQGVVPRRLEPALSQAPGTPNQQSHQQDVNPFWSPQVQRRASGTPASMPTAPVPLDVEGLRRQILEEAEAKFQRELLKGGTEVFLGGGVDVRGDGDSYKTASSGLGTQFPPPPPPPGQWVWVEPQEATPPAPPPPPPPAPLESAPMSSLGNASEVLRSLDLPSLPAPGPEGALLFGDWLTVATPLVYDVSASAREWWDYVIRRTEETYNEWLVATPLQKLRLRPDLCEDLRFHRVEQRLISMLLAALPEGLRRDVISARNLSSSVIMFRLYTTFQPGGGLERTGLLKNLTEMKVSGGPHEAAQALRQWRRWLSRAEELRLTLPDGLILMTVLAKVAESLSKLSGQVSYRIAAVRQELQVDTLPSLWSIKEFSEYLQAEAEEASVNIVGKTSSSHATSASALGVPAPPAVKALQVETQAEQKRTSSGGTGQTGQVCRFWGTEKGCRKAADCGYLHSWDGLDRQGRCFDCSGTGHTKRHCPYGKKVEKPEPTSKPKAAKVKGGTSAETASTSSTLTATPSTGAVLTGALGSVAEEAATRDPGVNPPPGLDQGKKEGKTESDDPSAELMKEAASLLKSLRSIRALQLKQIAGRDGSEEPLVALLDGGATHALREAKEWEREGLRPVKVELAQGSTTLYRRDDLPATLLSLEPVEPIIPLRLLVERGYSISWSCQGCSIRFGGGQSLDTWLRNGCPVMNRAKALKLLDELESQPVREETTTDRAWWRTLFPEAPDDVLDYMLRYQDLQKAGEASPWNRRSRRRLERSKGVVLHLFAGKHWKAWESMDLDGHEVLSVDLLQGSRYSLHDAGTWSYLWSLASQGRVKAILGGPPCRTTSRMRHSQPGPVPLRGRGATRYGLDGLSGDDLQKTHSDSALLLKQAGLWWRAWECGLDDGFPPGFLLESPRDPMEYLQDVSEELPSFWSWPEVQALQGKGGNYLVRVDQGCLGHARRKPTTLLTNLPTLRALDGRTGGGYEELAVSLEGRLQQSKEWATWAPGLVDAVQGALRRHLGIMEVGSRGRKLQRMTLPQWREHVLRNHIPFSRECRTCVREMGVDAPHRRQRKHPSVYSLNVDIIGPYVDGKDPGRHGAEAVRYALVATVPVPMMDSKGQLLEDSEPVAGDPGVEEADVDAAPEELVDLELPAEEAEPLDPDAVRQLNAEALQDFEQDTQRYLVKNVTMVEPLPSRASKHVICALNLLYAKFRSLGLPLYRLHSDKARELVSGTVQRWAAAKGMVQTVTSGDDPPSNGRVEAEICQLKRRLRVTLASSGAETAMWPTALRHVAQERLHAQLTALGVPMPEVPAYNREVLVKVKTWHKRGALKRLPSPFMVVRLLGPSPLLSHGWLVQSADGSLQHARSVVCTDPVATQAQYELSIEETPTLPPHRLGEKTSLFPGPKLPLGGLPADPPAPGGGESLPSLSAISTQQPCSLTAALPSSFALVASAEEYEDYLQGLHWGWKVVLEELLKEVPRGELEGGVHGATMEEVQRQVTSLEADLTRFNDERWEHQVQLCMLQAQAAQDPENASDKVGGVTAAEVLQTYTVPLHKVKEDPEPWLDPIRTELHQLLEVTKAVRAVRKADLVHEEGYDSMEVVPGKLVTTIKAPHGKRKARVVICGNLLDKPANVEEQLKEKVANYAGGIDSTALRCMLRKAADQSWSIGTVDIRTAFLLAPRTRKTHLLVVQPPKLLSDCGLIPKDQVWVVEKALYGLDTSPADWRWFRDETVKTFTWKCKDCDMKLSKTHEPNLWKVQSLSTTATDGGNAWKTCGFCAFYVDDVICVGDREVVDSFLTRLEAEWPCSPREWVTDDKWTKFLGFELKWKGSVLLLSQHAYIQELAQRHNIEESRPIPFSKPEEDAEEELNASVVRDAQGYVGELLWLAVRSRPDLAFGVAWLGQNATKRPRQVVAKAREMISYLKGTQESCLEYGPCNGGRGSQEELPFARAMSRIEVASDVSFAPNGQRSHQGLLSFYGGCLVQWISQRQPFGTLSTAESELLSYVDAMCLGESLECLTDIFEDGLWSRNEGSRVIYGDNQAAISIVQQPDGPWRTRHLRVRAFVLKEKVVDGRWLIRHVPGALLSADFLTKPITSKPQWTRFRQAVGMTPCLKCGGTTETAEIEGTSSDGRVARLVGLTGALAAIASWKPSVAEHEVARIATLAALTVGTVWQFKKWMQMPGEGHIKKSKEEPCGGQPKLIKSSEEPMQSLQGHPLKSLDGHSPGPTSSLLLGNQHCSPEGFPRVSGAMAVPVHALTIDVNQAPEPSRLAGCAADGGLALKAMRANSDGAFPKGSSGGRPVACSHPVSLRRSGANQHARWVTCGLCSERIWYEAYPRDQPKAGVAARAAAVLFGNDPTSSAQSLNGHQMPVPPAVKKPAPSLKPPPPKQGDETGTSIRPHVELPAKKPPPKLMTEVPPVPKQILTEELRQEIKDVVDDRVSQHLHALSSAAGSAWRPAPPGHRAAAEPPVSITGKSRAGYHAAFHQGPAPAAPVISLEEFFVALAADSDEES